MSAVHVSLAEINATAIHVLTREIGPANTARFLNQFTTGFGNYTDERNQILGEGSVTTLVAEIRQRRQEKPGRKKRSASRR